MLLRALLLQAFYSIRSERQLMERLEYDLLFRWFVGLGVDDPVWDHSTFSTNRDRLLDGDIAAKFLAAVLAQPGVKRLLSSEHFSVDGTLIEAWASMKSFKPKDRPGGDDDGGGDERRHGSRNAPADFKDHKRSNATHASTTDPDALLYRKGVALRGDHRRSPLGASHGHGGQALLHRPRPDGEPLRADRRRPVDPCLGSCRTAGRTRHDRAAWRQVVRDHPRGRQGL
jgi:hypothetical protein